MAGSQVRKPSAPEPDAGHIPMTEELDNPKWTMPPVATVAIALIVIALVIGAAAWLTRSTPTTASSIGNVSAVELGGGRSTLVAVGVTIRNVGEKTLHIRNSRASLVDDQGNEHFDDAASGADLSRYVASFPDLGKAGAEPLLPETKIPPGEERSGVVVVSFPVPKASFDARQNLSVVVDLYDRTPVTVSEK